MNREEINNKLEFMQELANRFPTKDDAVTEIINLNAILALPRGPEHFMSDLHGQADAFTHILNNSAGGIKFRIWQLFNGTLTPKEQDELATLIYYPKEKMQIVLTEVPDKEKWYYDNLLRIIEVTKKFSSRYTRSKVRKVYQDDNLSYIVDELLNNKIEEENKDKYYKEILNTIIELGYSEKLIILLSYIIKKLSVDVLLVVGDIYGDGIINARDFLIYGKYMTDETTIEIEDWQKVVMDLNFDGKIDGKDYDLFVLEHNKRSMPDQNKYAYNANDIIVDRESWKKQQFIGTLKEKISNSTIYILENEEGTEIYNLKIKTTDSLKVEDVLGILPDDGEIKRNGEEVATTEDIKNGDEIIYKYKEEKDLYIGKIIIE